MKKEYTKNNKDTFADVLLALSEVALQALFLFKSSTLFLSLLQALLVVSIFFVVFTLIVGVLAHRLILVNTNTRLSVINSAITVISTTFVEGGGLLVIRTHSPDDSVDSSIRGRAL